jgi:hypothetical protein
MLFKLRFRAGGVQESFLEASSLEMADRVGRRYCERRSAAFIPTFEQWRRAHGSGGSAVTQPNDLVQAADPATDTIYQFPTLEAAAGYRREEGIL